MSRILTISSTRVSAQLGNSSYLNSATSKRVRSMWTPFLPSPLSIHCSRHVNIDHTPPCSRSSQKSHCDKHVTHRQLPTLKLTTLNFWTSQSAWQRAGINTFRCLVGCSLGDFSTMWTLQSLYPSLGVGLIMTSSMAAGLLTSISLETVLLRVGKDGLLWKTAFKTAMGMSLVSMLSMEAVSNLVDYQLMGGNVDFSDNKFWIAAAVSAAAGVLAPLPYNYARLRKYGKACH
jgi:hypothetical protein